MIAFGEYFDPDLPTLTDMRKRYTKTIDLNTYFKLTDRDVADAIMQAGRNGNLLYIPGEPAYRIWDRTATFDNPFLGPVIGGNEITLSTPLRFKKFGPEINLLSSKATKKVMKGERVTPRKLFGQKFSDPAIRARLLEGAYRGWGYWDISKRVHRIVPFDVPAEGHKYMDLHSSGVQLRYQYADCYVSVPSTSRTGRAYEIVVKVLPVTQEGDEFLVEWTKTESEHVCEDRAFKVVRGRAGDNGDRNLDAVFKYSNPEEFEDRHTWGAREIAEDMSYKVDGAKPVLVKFPRPTGLIGPWHALKTRTIIGTEKKGRRPTKTDIGVLCGKLYGYGDIDTLFDLEESI